jgi:hypothetical protein
MEKAGLRFAYAAVRWVHVNNFDDAVKDVIAFSPPFVGEPESPYDIGIKEKCFIFFELHRSHNWVFSPAEDGMTSKGNLKGTYEGLSHFSWDGAILPNGDPLRDQCQLLCLAALSPLASYTDSFNFHVEFFQEHLDGGKPVKKRLPIIIDPDIKHPGGTQPT